MFNAPSMLLMSVLTRAILALPGWVKTRGATTAARIPKIATTAISSIRLKPDCLAAGFAGCLIRFTVQLRKDFVRVELGT